MVLHINNSLSGHDVQIVNFSNTYNFVITDQLQAHITGIAVQYFGISVVKEWQLKIVSASLEGRDTVVIQPTGSGKSLCFQLFPFISGKMTVVLTPTISLMKDQCCKLGERGIPATHTGSSQMMRPLMIRSEIKTSS